MTTAPPKLPVAGAERPTLLERSKKGNELWVIRGKSKKNDPLVLLAKTCLSRTATFDFSERSSGAEEISRYFQELTREDLRRRRYQWDKFF